MEVSTERLREMLALAEAATPGTWKCAGSVEKPCPVVLSDHPTRGYQLHNMNDVRDTDPQVWPFMKETYQRDAAHIGACSPDTMRTILTELITRREAST